MLALWAILHWERKMGHVALERMGIDVDVLARDIDRSLHEACEEIRLVNRPQFETLPDGRRRYVVHADPPLAPLLDAAEHEALGLGHNWVGSEHLLLAIIRIADTRIREVLDRYQIGYDRTRKTVVDIVSSLTRGGPSPT
jgi:ATP-dependent Clp protease ATP-binding subunit ClpA